MSITVTDYISINDKCEDLGFVVPTGVALLPSNFSDALSGDDCIYESNEATVRILFRKANIPLCVIEPVGLIRKSESKKSLTWYGPVLFFAVSVVSENPDIIAVSLGVIANYLTDFFRGVPGKHKIVLEIVTEKTKTKTTRKIRYEGDIEGLKNLPQSVLEEMNGN